MVSIVYNPAENLVGQQLNGKWEVTMLAPRPAFASGGTFSIGYYIRDDKGNLGFLKAINLLQAMQMWGATTQILRDLTDAYEYELKILRRCQGADRVAVAIDSGEYRDPLSPIPVPYLIFDKAEGDIRTQRVSSAYNLAFRLRCLHHLAVGMKQLHSRKIAHNDIKPSNVLIFKDSSKVGDLGRALDGESGSMYDGLLISGDRTYAPPELSYNNTAVLDWEQHRLGCDVYQLGSIIVYLFMDMDMNALLRDHIQPQFYIENWSSTYGDVLPYLMDGFARGMTTLQQAIDRTHPAPMGERLTQVARELCNPDYAHRGHPLNRIHRKSQYSLERYISLFDLLATSAEHNIVESLKRR
jgi:eukaryotic-like serine/threonine-protein kinase